MTDDDDDGGDYDYNKSQGKSHYEVSMRGESGSKENKTVEKYENKDANLESSIFLALSKWNLLNSQSV